MKYRIMGMAAGFLLVLFCMTIQTDIKAFSYPKSSDIWPVPVPETEAATERVTETGPAAEPETEPVTEPETESVTEAETEPETEPVTEAETEPETGQETETVTESATETETEPEAEPEAKPETKQAGLCLHAGTKQFRILPEMILSWKNADGSWNMDAVRTWLAGCIALFRTTDFETVFTDHDGQKHAFTSELFQWDPDFEKTLKAVCAAIDLGKSKQSVIFANGLTYDEEDCIGRSYVEVCIEKQTVWCYQDGRLVLETPCVTGTANGRDTDPGIYRIFYMQSPAVLRGPDYESPVAYWMAFNHCGEGLHDATWRSEFGGEIYKTSGSHGCVNLPFEAAQIMYRRVYTGYPVIVY